MPVRSISDEAAIPRVERSRFNTVLLRVPALVLLFSSAAIYEARHLTVLGDYDIWWHLRTGAWILQNHAVPHAALFTQYSDRPWIAYSWGFEVIAAAFYRLFGLQGVPVLQMCIKLALAVMVFRLARGSLRNFWPAVLLAAVGQYAITDFKARPGSLSILLFGIALILLFEIRRTGNVRRLFWLPLLFILWANLHIQFVYGLFALALFVVAVLGENLSHRLGMNWFSDRTQGTSGPIIPVLPVAAVAGACVLATLLTPYSYHTYQVVWQYAHSTGTYAYVAEMHAMDFRWTEHYVRLLLAMAACFALGYRRSRNLFALALLATSALIAFRQSRDTWFMVVTSIAVIADAYFSQEPAGEGQPPRGWTWEKLATAALVAALLVMAVIRYVPSSREALLSKVGETFPVKACDAIRENHLPPPIFNPLNWGGFLIWYLPDYPVAMDGRTDLYGDEIVVRQYKVWDGELPAWKEPTLIHARTLLVGRRTALAAALHESPGYRLVYNDELAAVFERMVGPDIARPK
jgi:hypothetical protein